MRIVGSISRESERQTDVFFPAGASGSIVSLVRHPGEQLKQNAGLLLLRRSWTGEPFPLLLVDYGTLRKRNSPGSWFGAQTMMTIETPVAGEFLRGTTGIELILL